MLIKRLTPRRFLEPEGSGSSGEGDAQAGQDSAAEGSSDDAGTGEGGETKPDEGAAPAAVFRTKEDLDRRLARAARKREKELRAKLQLGDDDDLEEVAALLTAKREADAAAKTDLERANEEIEASKSRLAELEERAERAEAALFVRTHGAKAGLVDDPDAVDLTIRRLAAWADEQGLGDDEELDDAQIAAFFATMKAAKPFLFGAAAARPATTGGDGGAGAGGRGAPGQTKPPVDALKMSPVEFAAHVAALGR